MNLKNLCSYKKECTLLGLPPHPNSSHPARIKGKNIASVGWYSFRPQWILSTMGFVHNDHLSLKTCVLPNLTPVAYYAAPPPNISKV